MGTRPHQQAIALTLDVSVRWRRQLPNGGRDAAKENGLDEERVTERSFRAKIDGREVPGMLWFPAAASGPVPLVLIGHGGSQHKRSDGPRDLAGLLVRDHGFAAAAIDGPVHGERRSDGRADPAAVFADHRADIEHPGRWRPWPRTGKPR